MTGLAERLRAGETLISGWTQFPEPLLTELVARQPFDAVTMDMQHGLHDLQSVMRSIGGVAYAGKPAVVRIAVADFATASRALDFGAEAVIAPMINSVADARALVSATKYPPVGDRSWGPIRALTVLGVPDLPTQLRTANTDTMVFAMVETARAIEVVDEILAVDGIDGVFMGPSDLSVTLSGGKEIAATADWLDAPIRKVADRDDAVGKVAGAFAVNPARARYFMERGYRFITLGTDQSYVVEGARAMLAAVRAP
ncbi:MAG: 2,4-dihydroxyhept-2-ene-1,7-dioic acid aldolase [Rhizobiales bacterium]|nr:2,4-dihydroxyhept-2-ene-1,7-dioic acid aldolase [Hyphomicrobiales bacterium]